MAEQLEKILERGDAEACLQFFEGKTEAERRKFSETANNWLKDTLDHYLASFSFSEGGKWTREQLLAGKVAVLCSASLSEILKYRIFIATHDDLTFRALKGRKPELVARWVDKALEQRGFWWRTVRELVKAGVCERPESDLYILKMINGWRPFQTTDANGNLHWNVSLVDVLSEETDLLEYEVWKLFEVVGGGEDSLANAVIWGDAFQALSEKNLLSRKRLLQASLEALARPFPQFQAGFFSRFHEQLKPTLEERKDFSEQYLGLLGSNIPPTVSFALKAVKSLWKADVYGADQLLSALSPVMRARAKGTVLQGLELIEAVLEKNPECNEQACLIAIDALGHEKADVQEFALGAIESRIADCDPQLTRKLSDYSEVVVPSLKPRVVALVTNCPETESVADQDADLRKERDWDEALKEIPACYQESLRIEELIAAHANGKIEFPPVRLVNRPFPELAGRELITPISTLEELVEEASAALENSGEIERIEKVLDGISRLNQARAEDFDIITGPLLKRTRDILERTFITSSPQLQLSLLIFLWLSGESFDRELPDDPVLGFLMLRIDGICQRIQAKKQLPLLSAPTHEGFFVSPIELAKRIVEYHSAGQDPEAADMIIALLRMPTAGRSDALKLCSDVNTEYGQAFRYALGADADSAGANAALWVAASRARNPWVRDELIEKAFPGLGPDTSSPVSISYGFQKKKTDGGESYTVFDIYPEPDNPCSLRRGESFWRNKSKKLGKYSVDPYLFPVHLFYRHDFFQKPCGSASESVRWVSSIWPCYRESFLAVGAGEIGNNVDWWEANWQNKEFLTPLLDPDVPLTSTGVLLLALGLGSKDPGEHILATDAAIAAIEDGRLCAELFGSTLAKLQFGEAGSLFPLARFTKRLAEISRASPLHNCFVAKMLETALSQEQSSTPKDYYALLEIFYELLVETKGQVESEAAKANLQAVKGAGKAAKAANKILKLEAKPNPVFNLEIVSNLFEHRLARAKRWMTRPDCTG